MKFAIGSRAYGKNSHFLAESDCFFDCLRKKEAEYEIIARKREGKFSEIGRLKYEIPRFFFNDGRNVRKSQLRIEKKCAIVCCELPPIAESARIAKISLKVTKRRWRIIPTQ